MSHTMYGRYTPKQGEMDMLNKILEESDAQLKQQVDEYIEQLVAQAKPELLEWPEALQLVVANETMAAQVRAWLAERGHNIKVVVAAPLPSKSSSKGDYWTPAMSEAKAAYAASHDALGQRVRHHAQFTKSQPSAQARKAARRRAKAGRRASR